MLSRSGVQRAAAAAVLMLFAATVGAGGPPSFKAGSFDPPRLAPDFSLQGSDGHELTMRRYRGKVVLLAFGFTSCAEICPVTLATLADARRRLGAAGAEVQVVYVTVDPERDVPERMRQYLASFDASFVGGSGSAQQLNAVQKDYGVFARKVPGASQDAYAYAHSSFTYLIDRRGRVRALMTFGHKAEDYVHDLAILLKE